MQNTNASTQKSRISLLLPKDLAKDVTTLARINQTTTNNFICGILREVVENNTAVIADYRDTIARFKSQYRSNDGDDVSTIDSVDASAQI